MKNRLKSAVFTAAVTMAAAIPFSSSADSVSAATKEDVIAAARAAGFPESYVQQGANYLEGMEYTSEQYDKMVSEILGYTGRTDEAIALYLGESGGSSSDNQTEPSQPEQGSSGQAEEKQPEAGQDTAGNDASSQTPAAAADQSSQENSAQPAEEKKDIKSEFASMTPEEQKEYIKNMPQAEKNQILKNLDRETQMEIINNLIDASASLGMNVSVDSFTKDKIEYSIRDDKGDVVDISSIGVIVDDTGIDYTALYLTAAGIVFVSAAGLTLISRSLKKGDKEI